MGHYNTLPELLVSKDQISATDIAFPFRNTNAVREDLAEHKAMLYRDGNPRYRCRGLVCIIYDCCIVVLY